MFRQFADFIAAPVGIPNPVIWQGSYRSAFLVGLLVLAALYVVTIALMAATAWATHSSLSFKFKNFNR